ncbi:suppressor of fused domain protein [Gordonia sp. PP30]|uniref:suppressor of fused domain protein n=1 Tax=unclassified Gordonia (in: high G+C Gram-positive bacteria) TaxID=2657482 RepID=UPI001FFF0D56|nr:MULTISPECIES: suppressor of fused domain protein [unclassified Gordonia (in: high G+C Gram-positive bacteria)]UQE76293.1 suppressor of fused domain protein [Gordonia sp. PP30]
MAASTTDRIAAHLTARLGAQPQRASVTFLGVEPIDVLRFGPFDGAQGAMDGAQGAMDGAQGAAELVFATVGCARHPMHDPADLAPDPERGPRAELVVRMRAVSPLPGLHRSLATVAAAPAVEGLVLGDDSLIDLQEPLWAGAVCSALLLSADSGVDDLPLDAPADPVRFLRAVPITANEAAWVRLKGAAALREAWAEGGVDVTDPARGGVTPA